LGAVSGPSSKTERDRSGYRAPLLFQRGSETLIHFLRGFFLHSGKYVAVDVESKSHL
jgi:hypothetical protein